MGALAALAQGCASVRPPPPPPDAATVYIADYGRHASLVLPRPGGGLVEYAYGEWEWFAKGDNRLVRAPAVLFSANPATLGRRELPDTEPTSATLESTLGAPRVLAIDVDADRAAALEARLHQSFEAQRDSLVYNPALKMEFVRDPRPYSLNHNSNAATADWLRELGADVRGPAWFSGFQVKQRAADAPTAPPSPRARWM